jgi:hypothetical protein
VSGAFAAVSLDRTGAAVAERSELVSARDDAVITVAAATPAPAVARREPAPPTNADLSRSVAFAGTPALARERAPRIEDQPAEPQGFTLASVNPFTDPLTRPRRRVAPFGAEAGSFGIRLTPGVDPETEKDRTSRRPLPKARKRARK